MRNKNKGHVATLRAEKLITRESDAWFLLAETYSPEHLWAGPLYVCDWLVCRLPELVSFQDQVADDTRAAMHHRVGVDVPSGGPAYERDELLDGMTPEEQVAARVLACLMFGWEAKSEGR